MMLCDIMSTIPINHFSFTLSRKQNLTLIYPTNPSTDRRKDTSCTALWVAVSGDWESLSSCSTCCRPCSSGCHSILQVTNTPSIVYKAQVHHRREVTSALCTIFTLPIPCTKRYLPCDGYRCDWQLLLIDVFTTWLWCTGALWHTAATKAAGACVFLCFATWNTAVYIHLYGNYDCMNKQRLTWPDRSTWGPDDTGANFWRASLAWLWYTTRNRPRKEYGHMRKNISHGLYAGFVNHCQRVLPTQTYKMVQNGAH